MFRTPPRCAAGPVSLPCSRAPGPLGAVELTCEAERHAYHQKGGSERQYRRHPPQCHQNPADPDCHGGPVVQNLPCNAGDVGSIPDRGTKIPRAAELLSPGSKAQVPQLESLQARILEWVAIPRKILWRRKWLPTPVSLPGESHGQRSLVGYIP